MNSHSFYRVRRKSDGLWKVPGKGYSLSVFEEIEWAAEWDSKGKASRNLTYWLNLLNGKYEGYGYEAGNNVDKNDYEIVELWREIVETEIGPQ